MRMRNLGAGLMAAMTFCTLLAAPLTAQAQRGWDNDRDKRDRRDNDRDWNNRRGNGRDWNDLRNWDNRRDKDWRDNDRDWRDRRDRDWDRNDRNDWRDNDRNRRQDMKNEWRNIAIGSGLVGVLGLLQRDNRLVFAGGAGAVYSLYRYEQDRRSQNQLDRARALYFSQPYFYRDGTRFERQIVTRNGERCYQFVRR